jgi:hypothetical protein
MEFGAFIPIFALLIPIVAIWTKHQQKMAEMGRLGPTFDDSAIRAQDAKVKALEERVKVLERIVTDANRGTSLAAQIDALRDDTAGTPSHSGVPLTFEKERV